MPNIPIEISAKADEWNSDDTIVFRNFIEGTKTGRKVLARLLESTPALLPAGDTNAICIRSGEVRGYGLVARAFVELAYPAPDAPAQTDNYPALEDDSKWPEDTKPKPDTK